MQFVFPAIDGGFYLAALPILILCFASILAMLQAVAGRLGETHAVAGTLFLAIFGALLVTFVTRQSSQQFLGGALVQDLFSVFGQRLILILAGGLALMAWDTPLRKRFYSAEMASLYLMVVTGMLVMVSSLDLVTLFVGLELSSIGLYCLVGYLEPSARSQEGAIKYFVIGSVAAALLLFGVALLYAGTGTLNVEQMLATIPLQNAGNYWILLGALLVAVAIATKLALVPFHLWAPDAYESAPTVITALMATTVKIMTIIFALRIFAGGMAIEKLSGVWVPALTIVAGLSMIVGNIMALIQTSMKRMLAYSSISHSGYLAVAICSLVNTGSSNEAIEAIMFYLVSYSIVSLAAFGLIMWLEGEKNANLQLDDIVGLGRRHPWLAASLCICMLAFAGMPPTIGFLGKFFVFRAALTAKLYGIVAVGAIGSAISFYYYLNVIVKMYLVQPRAGSTPLAFPGRLVVAGTLVAVSVLLIIAVGILPGPLMQLLKI